MLVKLQAKIENDAGVEATRFVKFSHVICAYALTKNIF